MKLWVEVLKEYDKTGSVAKCPYCGSDKMSIEEHHGKVRNSISFLCESCRKGAHFDGVTKK